MKNPVTFGKPAALYLQQYSASAASQTRPDRRC
jgi:hypothetical protein